MKTASPLFALLAPLLLLLGCANSDSPATTKPSSVSAAHAECMVCKMNVDLACIDVDVDKNTPSYSYNGKTYYFCSDDCRTQFIKNPAKYARK